MALQPTAERLTLTLHDHIFWYTSRVSRWNRGRGVVGGAAAAGIHHWTDRRTEARPAGVPENAPGGGGTKGTQFLFLNFLRGLSVNLFAMSLGQCMPASEACQIGVK